MELLDLLGYDPSRLTGALALASVGVLVGAAALVMHTADRKAGR